jgi:tetratricopeptide (TPR) repeat protein
MSAREETRHDLGVGRFAVLISLFALTFDGCHQDTKARRDYFLAAGQKMISRKDYASAILEFKNAAQVAPGAEPYYQLGNIALIRQEWRSADAYFREANEIDPKHVGAQRRIAELLGTSNSRDVLIESQTRAKAVLNLQPDDPDALNTLALTEYKLGDGRSAEQDLRRAMDKAPALLRSFVNLAAIRLDRKDQAGAEAILKQAVAAFPQSVDAWITLGRFYVSIGDLRRAESALRRAVDREPSNPVALCDLGRLQVTTGRLDEADKTLLRLSHGPDPKFAPVHAVFLFSQGETAKAILELEALVGGKPRNHETRSWLIAAYVAAKRWSDAERLLSEALQTDHRDLDAHLQRADLYLRQRNAVQAEHEANEAVRYGALDPRAHYVLARIYHFGGNEVLWRQELTEVLRLDPYVLPARLELADALVNSKLYDAALITLDAAPDPQNRSLTALVEKNWIFLASGDSAEARRGVDKGLRLRRIPDLIVQDGLLKIHQKDFAAARVSFGEVLQTHPANLRALAGLTNSYFAAQRIQDGVDKLKEFSARQPEQPEIQLYLGQILAITGDVSGARAAFAAARKASTDDPVNEYADMMQAQMDFTDGKVKSARAVLETLVKNNRGGKAAARLLGFIDQQGGKCADAIPMYRKAFDRDRNDWQSLNNLAVCLNTVGDHDEALKFAQRAEQLAEGTPAVKDTLGWAFYNKGLYKSAIRSLEPLSGDSSALHQYHLAMAYIRADDLDHAATTLDRARKLGTGLAEAEIASTLFEEASRLKR